MVLTGADNGSMESHFFGHFIRMHVTQMSIGFATKRSHLCGQPRLQWF